MYIWVDKRTIELSAVKVVVIIKAASSQWECNDKKSEVKED